MKQEVDPVSGLYSEIVVKEELGLEYAPRHGSNLLLEMQELHAEHLAPSLPDPCGGRVSGWDGVEVPPVTVEEFFGQPSPPPPQNRVEGTESSSSKSKPEISSPEIKVLPLESGVSHFNSKDNSLDSMDSLPRKSRNISGSSYKPTRSLVEEQSEPEPKLRALSRSRVRSGAKDESRKPCPIRFRSQSGTEIPEPGCSGVEVPESTVPEVQELRLPALEHVSRPTNDIQVMFGLNPSQY